MNTFQLENQISAAKSTVGVFDLPCGFLDQQGVLHTEVVLKEMTSEEEDLFAAKNISSPKRLNGLMAGCIERLGSITDKGKIAIVVPNLLLGDRVFLLFAIRRVTFGNAYMVQEACPECERKGDYNIDLSELDLKKMKEPMKRLYEVTLPSGKSCKLHPASGLDEIHVAEQLNKGEKKGKAQDLNPLSTSILMRVESVNEQPANLNVIKALSAKDTNFLREYFDEIEGGVDTSVTHECGFCEEEFERDVNLDTGFFFPSMTRKRSKTK